MVTLNKVPKSGQWNTVADIIDKNFAHMEQAIKSREVTVKMPQFDTLEAAKAGIKLPYEGQMILIGSAKPLHYHKWDGSTWKDTGMVFDDPSLDLAGYPTTEEMDAELQIRDVKLSELEKKTEYVLLTDILSINKINESLFTEGFYINKNGDIAPLENTSVSPLYDVRGAGKNFYTNLWQYTFGVFAYDINLNLIGEIKKGSSVGQKAVFTYPSRTAYIRYYIKSANLDSSYKVYLYVEDINTYYPYGVSKYDIHDDSTDNELKGIKSETESNTQNIKDIKVFQDTIFDSLGVTLLTGMISINKVDKALFLSDYYLNARGEIKPLEGTSLSPLYDIRGAGTCFYTNMWQYPFNIFAYDIDLKVIGEIKKKSSAGDKAEFEYPQHTVYVRYHIKSAILSNNLYLYTDPNVDTFLAYGVSSFSQNDKKTELEIQKMNANLASNSQNIEKLQSLQGELVKDVKSGVNIVDAFGIEGEQSIIDHKGLEIRPEKNYILLRDVPIDLTLSDYTIKGRTYLNLAAGYGGFAFLSSTKSIIFFYVPEQSPNGQYNDGEFKISEILPSELHKMAKYVCLMAKTKGSVSVVAERNYAATPPQLPGAFNGYYAGQNFVNANNCKPYVKDTIVYDLIEHIDLSGDNDVRIVARGEANDQVTGIGNNICIVLFNKIGAKMAEATKNDFKSIFADRGGAKAKNFTIKELFRNLPSFKGKKFDDVGKMSYKYLPYPSNSKNKLPIAFFMSDTVIKEHPLTAYTGMKMDTYGDSVTENSGWQWIIAECLGLNWEWMDTNFGKGTHKETSEGYVAYPAEDGTYFYFNNKGIKTPVEELAIRDVKNRRTGYWGTLLMARKAQNDEKDGYRVISDRIREAFYYHPDFMTLWGGFNDVPYLTYLKNHSDGDKPTYAEALGDATDKPWYGLTKNTATSIFTKDGEMPSFCSCYKGCIEVVIRTMPRCKVVCFALHHWYQGDGGADDAHDGNNNTREQWNEVVTEVNNKIREICKIYSVPFIDLENNVGFSQFDYKTYLDGPHPKSIGFDRIAQYAISQLW